MRTLIAVRSLVPLRAALGTRRHNRRGRLPPVAGLLLGPAGTDAKGAITGAV